MSSLKEFIAQNGIVATTAGITIGFATATFIKSLVADVVMPLIFIVIAKSAGKNATFFTKYLANKDFMLANFISEFITWLLILIFAWVVLGIAYKYLSTITIPKIPPVFGGPVVSQEQKVFQQQAQKPAWY